MSKEALRKHIYIGVVEDNKDPKKLGRCRVRVFNIFDDIPVEDIPWASPWKDLNGNGFTVPEKGKVLSVVFDEGNKYKPEYICAEHYNVNLEKKLESLGESDYLSMRTLLFDHKTQIYSNDNEGLKIDYKFNNINITDTNIDVNLKDNFGTLNLGTSTANQQAILGNHFLDWFDEFLDNLLGSRGGPYLGNLGAPVVANPDLIQCISKYKALKDPKFLSHHVNIVDNEYVNKLDRVCDPQLGDTWKSTVKENETVVKERPTFLPQSGNSTDTPEGDLTTSVDEKGVVENAVKTEEPPKVEVTVNPDLNNILKAMERKKYKILTRPFEANIVGIRRQYEGQKYSNAFKDDLFLFFKDSSGNWQTYKFKISTMPGFYNGVDVLKDGKWKFKKDKNSKLNVKQSQMMLGRGGMGILMEAQYINLYTIGDYHSAPAMKTLGAQKFYRDTNPTDTITYAKKGEGTAAMYIHLGYNGGRTVDNWSEGCQVFSQKSEHLKFFDLCQEHKKRYGNKFNYTLMLERDL